MDPMDHSPFMARAVALSREHMRAGDGGPFGAVVVKDGAIIGEGWNRVTSANDPTAHAEIVAIREACARLGAFSLEGATIYASCEPCPMCLSAIYWARIGAVYYANDRVQAAAIGFDDEYLYHEVAAPIEARALPMIRLPDADAAAVFAEWTRKADKTPY